MPKFRKKPIVIDAEQWFPGRQVPGVIARTEQMPVFDAFDSPWQTVFGIETLEGFMKVSPGDWVITGVHGERYPCKPDIFGKTYEEVSDELL